MENYRLAAGDLNSSDGKGHGEALFRLGQCYEEGLLQVDRNLNLALQYYKAAKAKQHKNAPEALDRIEELLNQQGSERMSIFNNPRKRDLENPNNYPGKSQKISH